MSYRDQQEAHRDALDMERNSVLAPDDDELDEAFREYASEEWMRVSTDVYGMDRNVPEHKRRDYMERMRDAADNYRMMKKECQP